ncbi:TetR family transcriptional regulator [Streptomyces sp. SID3212]|uniref:TetR/AcrR family transcriptional regulator n=1 Tax=Streptomyces sp. SID3212 TaxID=2690259 RepID=UPI001F0076AF|nr:TetR family transcriptional regulator [Streptomyces sp. SID3212]
MAAPSHHPLQDPPPRPGLRERKKLRTRTGIRRATHRLIAEQGYEATTVEQIARAAEVSPSTVFRYFPAKEDIVLSDEYDSVLAAGLRARPAGESPLDALRFTLTDALRTLLAEDRDALVQRTRLTVEVPAIRARTAETRAVTVRLLTAVLAERTGRAPGDLELRVLTAAVLGALGEATLSWGERGCRDDLPTLIERAFGALESGLRLRERQP